MGGRSWGAGFAEFDHHVISENHCEAEDYQERIHEIAPVKGRSVFDV